MEENAFWHRRCYAETTNKTLIQRVKDRNVLSTEQCSVREQVITENIDEPGPSRESPPFTRSFTEPLNKDICFFCQEDTEEKLFKVCTQNAGQSLKSAIDKSEDVILRTRLNTCISPTDAHAMDVRYHKSCWRKHVFHIKCEGDDTKHSLNVPALQNASLIELINLIDIKTKTRAHISMYDIEMMYMNLLGPNGIENHVPAFSRKWLKKRILTELPHVQDCRPDKKRASVLYSPAAYIIDSPIGRSDNMDAMSTLYKAAQILRKAIADFKKAKPPNVIPVSSNTDDVPSELYTMIRWIILGPADTLDTEKTTSIDRISLTISQNILYGFKTNRQVKYKASRDSATFRSGLARENPQVVGLALIKKLPDLLNAQG